MVAAKRPILESLRRDHIIELLGKGQRVDGRKLTEQRKLTIEIPRSLPALKLN